MKKLIEKILFKFGFVRRSELGEFLVEIVKESVKRDGVMFEFDKFGIRFKIAARYWIK